MFKFIAVVLMTIAVVAAKPKLQLAVAPVAYSAPLVASPVVTATSSQVFTRNYNAFATPVVAAYTADVSAPLVSAAAPLAAAYTSPYAATYTSPYAAAYSYSPYAYSAYAF